MRVGVLALQGAFEAHGARLRELGHEVRYVRAVDDVDRVDGLVLPGGESGAMLRMMTPPLAAALDAVAARGPVLATCAGLILVARRVDPTQACFGWLDVDVRRNGWGRQLDSAETTDDDGRPIVLIRAPRITRVGAVEVEATVDGEPVLVRRGPVWGATFHPELVEGSELHERVFGSRVSESAAVAESESAAVAESESAAAPESDSAAASAAASESVSAAFVSKPPRARARRLR